jgi:hypothetical protein
VRRLQGVPAAPHLGQLGQHEVERAGGRGDGEQGPGAHALHAGQVRRRLAAGGGGRGPGPRQQAILARDRAAGGGGQGQRLQQRQRPRYLLAAEPFHGGGRGPVLADQDGQRGEQFGHVQVHLPVRGGQLGEAEVDDPGLAGRADHHVGGPQRPVGDSGPVQPAHLGPQPGEQVVAGLAVRQPVQRAAIDPFHDEQRGVPGPDDPVDAGHGHPGPFGHDADQGLALDRVEERRGGAGVAHVPQPHRPVRPVQQVGVALVRPQGLDEQPPPVRCDRRELPRALGLDLGRADRGHREPREPQRRRDLAGSYPLVGHAERHQDRGAHRDPGGQGEDQLHRQHRAGQDPHHAGQQQREPRDPAPGPAQPGRGGHHHSRRGREQRRGGKRGARHPGAAREAGRERGRALAAEQGEDRGRDGGGGHRPRGQPGQQPVPAPAQRGGDHQGHRDQACDLHQAGDDAVGRPEVVGHRRGRAEELPGRDP